MKAVLEQLLLFGLVGHANVALAHAAESGVGIEARIVAITPFNAEGIAADGFNIF